MKNEIFSWILVFEITLPLLILCVVLLVIVYGNYKRNKEAARNLILKIKNNEDTEKAAILAFLTKTLAVNEQQAKAFSKKIINERKFLFRNLISGLLDKNVEAIASLESDMSRITGHYHQLKPGLVKSDAPPVEDNSEKITELKQEIKSLKHEIHITLTTLNNIFAEFSSMFGEEVPDTEMSVDQIITAMESFSGKNAPAAEPATQEEASLDDFEDDEPDAFAEVENALEEIAAEAEAVEESDVVSIDIEPANEETEETTIEAEEEAASSDEEESLDFSLDDELDDIDSALDELELGSTADDEPSWDDAFEQSGDKKK